MTIYFGFLLIPRLESRNVYNEQNNRHSTRLNNGLAMIINDASFSISGKSKQIEYKNCHFRYGSSEQRVKSVII